MADIEYTIKTVELTKKFLDVTAVDRLSVEVERGEIFGLVGPDGAGKTTTMRMLASIMDPTSGEATVAGYDVKTQGQKVMENIAYMSQKFGLYDDLSVQENILFYADLYDVPSFERPALITKLLGFSQMEPFRHRMAGKLSGGMKQKLGLACALIHKPQVLLLDEPTNGVDPISRREFWQILYELLEEKVTIFVSTAYLDEAERAGRVGLIHKGRMFLCDTPKAIQKYFPYSITGVKTSNNRIARDVLKNHKGVKKSEIFGEYLHIIVEKTFSDWTSIEELLKNNRLEIFEYRNMLPSLEDSFINLIEEG